jgi:LacI family transcriptional regulator
LNPESYVRVTIKNIAQDLGISHSTVSRVLNDKQSHLISDATRERIMEAASRLGYRPNRIAQALQGKGTQLIGIFVPDTDDYFFQTVLKNMRHTLEESGYELMVFESAPNQITAKWHRLLEWDLDGVFVFDYLFIVDGLWEALSEHSGPIPAVVGLFSSNTQLKDYVTVNFRPALEALMAHLYGEGCRSFAYMAYTTSLSRAEQRYSVFSDFVAKHNGNQQDIPVLTGRNSHMEGAREGLAEWLRSGRQLPDAIFCQNDEIAMGAYRALCDAGVRIPEQLALAGCDDLPYISYFETPLTSIYLPVREVCREGWRILQQRIADPDGTALQIVLEGDLRLRASCIRQGL